MNIYCCRSQAFSSIIPIVKRPRMKVNRVAIIGECMVELHKQGAYYKQSFGGDTLNTALYLSRLTHQQGIITSYVTGLGKDPFSQQMLTAWQQEAINTDLVAIS